VVSNRYYSCPFDWLGGTWENLHRNKTEKVNCEMPRGERNIKLQAFSHGIQQNDPWRRCPLRGETVWGTNRGRYVESVTHHACPFDWLGGTWENLHRNKTEKVNCEMPRGTDDALIIISKTRHWTFTPTLEGWLLPRFFCRVYAGT
jgi:hypothetical protein